MTGSNAHSEILTKAIEKAIAGGWQPFQMQGPLLEFKVIHSVPSDFVEFIYQQIGVWDGREGRKLYPEQFIFRHDFVQELWMPSMDEYEEVGDDMWKFHLQEMVIADDPIEYLGAHL